jgi:GNAT superfamily N-acetyltransferase
MLNFSAEKEDDPTGSRARLYDRMIQRYIGGTGYDLTREDMPGGATYTLTKQAQGVTEAFDQPYRTKSEKSDYGDIDMLAKLPDGTNLSIMFNNQGDDEWQVEFYRDNSQEVTGGGDAQRVFATVLTSMQKFIKKYKPWRLTFSANKDIQPGQNSESRAKLYNRLVQRYAAAWGYEEYSEDHGDQIAYELTQLKPGVAEDAENFNGIDISIEVQDDEVMVRATAGGRELGHVLFVEEGEYLMPQDLEVEERFQGQGIAAAMYDYVKSKGYKIRRSGQQTDAGAGFWGKHRPEQNVWENFADGRNPQDKGDSKRHGINTKASVSSLRKTAKQGGRKGQLAHWLANMKSGRAKAKKK